MIDSSRVAVGSHGQSCLCDGSFKVINNVISKGYTVLLLPDPTKAAKREGDPYVPIIPITGEDDVAYAKGIDVSF